MVRTVSHYEILEEIAEGGMGVVYKARDTRLDRLVALKFLPGESGSTTERFERFLHEARAISRLNHPHIATIYDIDDDGDRFMAFEYLPGGTLRSRIGDANRGKRLAPTMIVRYAIQIAEALAHAHRHGIVHRDVKTDNVLLSEDGIVKLTDFGVARISGREDPSGEHVTVGTAAYTSPEQATGRESDHRSDIFSFGVVLFEMAAGHVPFPGDREEVILYDIAHSPAPPLSDFRSDLPEGFIRIVERSLEKEPADRYQSMDDVLRDLCEIERGLVAVPVATRPLPAEATIAVLPFVDMSPARDQEYFCDGIAEEIINVLAAVKGIRVVSRTSSFQFKGLTTDIREIGEKLNVQTVLEGSIRKAGDLLRITVQHIDVADGYHIWSERYDRELDDVFAIQDEISAKIVEHLRTNLLPGEGPRAGARRASNVEAYSLYLKGRFHLNQRSKEGILASVGEFERACCEDCNFALPFAGLAEAQLLVAAHGFGSAGERDAVLAKARAAAQEAIRRDETCAEAHVALGMVHSRADWNWKAAEVEFKKAIALNDGLALAHHQYAMYLALRRRPDEAVREICRAFELDPLSSLISSAVGRVLYFAGRYDESIEQLRHTLELYPDYGNVYFDLGVSYARTGRYEEGREVMARLDALLPGDVRAKIVTGWIDARSGHEADARALLQDLEQYDAPPMSMAVIYAGLGEIDRALTALEAAVEERDLTLPYVGVEAAYDPLRSDPRMDAILQKLGLAD